MKVFADRESDLSMVLDASALSFAFVDLAQHGWSYWPIAFVLWVGFPFAQHMLYRFRPRDRRRAA